MAIALDMDDVLVELTERFREFHNDTFGTTVARDQCQTYDFERVFGTTQEEMTRRLKVFFNSGYCIDIHPVEGAQEVVAHLAKRDMLYVVTARPIFARYQTEKCLDLLFPGQFSEVYLTNQWHGEGEARTKSSVCNEIGAEMLVDDSLKHALDCAEQGIQVKLFDRPWNQAAALHPNITRVYSWREIGQVLSSR